MSSPNKIRQKYISRLNSQAFYIEQSGSIKVVKSDGSEVDLLKLNGSNAALLMGNEVANKIDLDGVIADLEKEADDREAGDLASLNSAKAYTNDEIQKLVNGAPQMLDTLKELADALGSDPNFASSIATLITNASTAIATEETRAKAAEKALSDRLDIVEPHVENLLVDVAAAETNIGNLQTSMSAVQTSLNDVVPKVSTLEDDMVEVKGDVSVLKTDMVTAKSDINALKVRAKNAEDRLDLLEDDMESAKQDINSLFTDKADISYVNSEFIIRIQEAKDYAEDKADDAQAAAELYARTQDLLKLEEAKQYADTKDGEKLLEANQYAFDQDALRLADAKDYTDDEVAKEAALRVTGDQNSLDSAKQYTDAEVLKEKNRAMGIEGDLQSAINVEKGRVDAILSASTADKDSFAEIVSLINSVDLENDTALASVILAEQNARKDADDALDARLDILEGADSVEGSVAKAEKDAKDYADSKVSEEASARTTAINQLDARLDILEGADSVEGSVAKAEKDAKDYADSKFATAQSSLDDVEGFALEIRTDLDNEIGRAQAAEGALDGRLDLLEAMAFYKESKQVGSGDLSFVELAREAKPNSIKAYVGRLALHENEDFYVSVQAGKSRLNWMGDFMVGGPEEIEVGMKLFFEYYC